MKPTLNTMLRDMPNKLYSYWEIREGMEVAYADNYSWYKLCDQYKVWQIFNKEFVADLAELLQRLNGEQPVLEVMAGTGILAKHLNAYRNGLVHATDIGGTEQTAYCRPNRILPIVETDLDWQDAVARYQPSVVLACWVPYGMNMWDPLMEKFPCVKFGVDIGEGFGGCTGPQITYDNPEDYEGARWYSKVEFERDEKASEHCIAKTDYPDGCYHTHVHVVRRLPLPR